MVPWLQIKRVCKTNYEKGRHNRHLLGSCIKTQRFYLEALPTIIFLNDLYLLTFLRLSLLLHVMELSIYSFSWIYCSLLVKNVYLNISCKLLFIISWSNEEHVWILDLEFWAWETKLGKIDWEHIAELSHPKTWFWPQTEKLHKFVKFRRTRVKTCDVDRGWCTISCMED